MEHWNTDKILKILLKCGEIALSYYDAPGYELKEDQSIVTKADRAIEKFLANCLNNPENNSYLIGEETILSQDDAYIKKALNNTAWVVDPIDGTAPYSHHIPTWGISIAYLKKGKILEGAIYLPLIGEIFISKQNKILYSSKPFSHDSLKTFVKPKTADSAKSLVSVTQEITKYYTMNIPNPVQSICSAVFSMTQLMQRRYIAYILSPHIKLWDFAAGLCLLKNAGIITRYNDGENLTLNAGELCNLDKTGINRWKLNREAIFATSEKNFNLILKNINFK